MKNLFLIILSFVSLILSAQYAPQANTEGTTAIHMDSSIIVSWATAYENYLVGTEVDATWQTPEKALGHAAGTSGDIVCLGRGGQITLSFDTLIVNLDGPDFVCFENGFSNTFLELGWVEVSYDGVNFERFPNHSLTASSVGPFGDVDPTKINGYCSKYRQGYGTPFDLDSVSLDTIRYIRLVDIVGDGTAYDSDGHVIYDPYATTGSAGLDVEAIGVIHAGTLHEGVAEISSLNFKMYPNPAKDKLNIVGLNELSSQTPNSKIEIYNLTGKLVKQFYISNTSLVQINISDLKQGLYLVKLGQKSQKISIKR